MGRETLPICPWLDGSWAYLATWMDLFSSRLIVGWKISTSLDASLVIHSFEKALLSGDSPNLDLIVHSDGGGQYMDLGFRERSWQRINAVKA